MCLLAYFEPNAEVNWNGLKNACLNNPDGFGWAIHHGDHIEIDKSMDYMTALESFYDARKGNEDKPSMFHARFATHGTEDLLNVHPFYSGENKDLVLAHNGVLPVNIPKGDPRSDTRYFAEVLLPLRSARLFDRRNKLRKLEKWMSGSKFVVFSTRPELAEPVYIVNEGDGHWVNGTWWSNDSYKDSYFRYFSSWKGVLSDYDAYDAPRTPYTGSRPLLSNDDPVIDEDRLCPCCESYLTQNERLVYRFCTTCSLCLDCEEWQPNCLCFVPEGTSSEAVRKGTMPMYTTCTLPENGDIPEWDYAFAGGVDALDGPTDAELQAIARDAVIEANKGKALVFLGDD